MNEKAPRGCQPLHLQVIAGYVKCSDGRHGSSTSIMQHVPEDQHDLTQYVLMVRDNACRKLNISSSGCLPGGEAEINFPEMQ